MTLRTIALVAAIGIVGCVGSSEEVSSTEFNSSRDCGKNKQRACVNELGYRNVCDEGCGAGSDGLCHGTCPRASTSEQSTGADSDASCGALKQRPCENHLGYRNVCREGCGAGSDGLCHGSCPAASEPERQPPSSSTDCGAKRQRACANERGYRNRCNDGCGAGSDGICYGSCDAPATSEVPSDDSCGANEQPPCPNDRGFRNICDPGCGAGSDGKCHGTCGRTVNGGEVCPEAGSKVVAFTIDHYNGQPTDQLARRLDHLGLKPTVFVDGRDLDFDGLVGVAEVGMHGWSHTRHGNGRLAEEVSTNALTIRGITGFVPRVAAYPSDFREYAPHFQRNGAQYIRSIRSSSSYNPHYTSSVPQSTSSPSATVLSWVARNSGPFTWFAHAPLRSHEEAVLSTLIQEVNRGRLVAMSFYGAHYCRGRAAGTVVPPQQRVQ